MNILALIDFQFDFDKYISKAYTDYQQDIAYIAEGLDGNSMVTEDAIKELIKINSAVLSDVLKKYNYELLNEIHSEL